MTAPIEGAKKVSLLRLLMGAEHLRCNAGLFEADSPSGEKKPRQIGPSVFSQHIPDCEVISSLAYRWPRP